jgi:hypothetical protein
MQMIGLAAFLAEGSVFDRINLATSGEKSPCDDAAGDAALVVSRRIVNRRHRRKMMSPNRSNCSIKTWSAMVIQPHPIAL